MGLIKRKKIYNVLIMFLVVIMAVVINTSLAKATGDKPNLNITYTGSSKTTSTDINGVVNEEIQVNYMVTPEPLALGDVNIMRDKEIVLVLDTSGSMKENISGSTTRISALKTAAKNFIDKFKNETNVKIGVATYSTNANYDGKSMGLTSTSGTSNQNTLKNNIDRLQANGGTNIGDGIRYALNMINNGTNAKKYVILMSDGEPTYYMYKNKYKTERQWVWDWWLISGHYEDKQVIDGWEYYTDLSNDGNPKVGGPGNSDNSQGQCLEYASIMAAMIKDKNYSSYNIAYSSGASSNKMLQLSESAGGRYFSALDANAIDQVYSDIADEIRADYLVEGVKFNFTVPENLEYTGSRAELIINGDNYTQQLPNISYRLDTSVTPNRYIADQFPISFKFKATRIGNFNNIASGWNVTYKGVDGNTITKNLPSFNYSASRLNLNYNLTKEIPGYSDSTLVGTNLQMNYKIVPQDISVTNTRKAKNVVLVVDSSYSNKDNIKNFLNKFNNISDVKFSLVVYESGAKLYNFGTEEDPNYFVRSDNQTLINNINGVTSSDGSNLGEGLRKALFALNNVEDVSRSIVVFGENNPNYYSYSNDSAGSTSYYNDIDNNNGTTDTTQEDSIIYGTDGSKAAEYSELIAQKIADNKNLSISTITAGDDVNDEVLKEISSISSTEFNNISDNFGIDKLYNIVNSDLILDSRLREDLPDGVVFDNGSTNLERNMKVFYKYNNTTKKYTSSPITISTNIKTTKVGQYLLNNAKFYYKDIEGIEMPKSFNSIALNAITNSLIRQGMFFAHNSERTSGDIPGESYIKASSSKRIAINSTLNMGTLVKTSSTKNVIISINNDNNNQITIPEESISATVYEVNVNTNIITSIEVSYTRELVGNRCMLKFNLPVNGTEEKYFLINYNYKINPSNGNLESNFDGDGIGIVNKSCIEGDEDSTYDIYNYNVVGLPDLF